MSEFINKAQTMEHFGIALVGIRSIISPLEMLLVRRKARRKRLETLCQITAVGNFLQSRTVSSVQSHFNRTCLRSLNLQPQCRACIQFIVCWL